MSHKALQVGVSFSTLGIREAGLRLDLSGSARKPGSPRTIPLLTKSRACNLPTTGLIESWQSSRIEGSIDFGLPNARPGVEPGPGLK